MERATAAAVLLTSILVRYVITAGDGAFVVSKGPISPFDLVRTGKLQWSPKVTYYGTIPCI